MCGRFGVPLGTGKATSPRGDNSKLTGLERIVFPSQNSPLDYEELSSSL